MHSRCPSILGELLPAQGRYYWETVVSGCAAYRLGVAHDAADRSSPLGENHLSWCLQCVPTPSGYARASRPSTLTHDSPPWLLCSNTPPSLLSCVRVQLQVSAAPQ